MARKRRKKQRPPSAKGAPKRASIGFLLGAIGIGVLFIIGGVAMAVLGRAGAEASAGAATPQMAKTGYWLIAMGVAAIVLSVVIYRTGS